MRDRSLLQTAAMLLGVVFLLVGILGFVPGITSHYSRLGTFGDVAAKLLHIFGVNWLENVVHLLYSVAGITLAKTWAGARNYFVFGGVIYLVLWIYGLLINLHGNGNFIGVNTAGNWLHFVLGLVMVGLGLVLGRRIVDRDRAGTAPAI